MLKAIKVSALFLGAMAFMLPCTVFATEISDAQICRAGIATIMGKTIDEVRFDREVKQVKYVSFDPTEENTTFKFKCTVASSKIQWASEFGSWKDSDLDSDVSYEIKENFLIVSESYNSGYTFNKRFSVKFLKDKK